MASRREGWVDANNVCLRYELSGDGPHTLVLVHEMGGSLESWDEVARALRDEFALLRYDQRGFGLSEKSGRMSLDEMVDDLATLLDALSLNRQVTLVGAALGAAICLAFALRYPHRVKCLVVSSPATGGVAASTLAAMETRLQAVSDGGVRAITDTMFAVTYPASMPVKPERFKLHRKRWLTTAPESFIAQNRMLTTFDLVPDLPRIACPTLVIGCIHDTVRTPGRSAELAALMPGATYAEAASGHYMPIQTPELFAGHVRDFVSSQGADSSD